MERFSISGSQVGSFVDEFDDGTISPAWTLFQGTAQESDGRPTLSDPGAFFHVRDLSSGLDMELETSQIHQSGALTLADGQGDFEMRSSSRRSSCPRTTS